jgi:hypothetical protein
MKTSGPRGNNLAAFTKTIGGTSHRLGSYCFDSKNTSYANAAGNYTVALWIKDSAGQTTYKTFSVRVK